MNDDSDMQRRFGAKMKVSRPPDADRQLFFILGSVSGQLAGTISGLDGKVVLQGPNWVLAEMGFSSAMALRRIPGVRLAGGVSMDSARAEQIRKVLELNRG